LRHFFDVFEVDQVVLNDPALTFALPAFIVAGIALRRFATAVGALSMLSTG
jgi:hypothetical protein